MQLTPKVLPKIFIDARMVGPVPHGFGRYVSNLVRGLELLTARPYSVTLLVASESLMHWKKNTSFETVAVTSPFLSPLEWFEIPQVLFRGGASLYHSPTFSSLPFCPCPHVVTVHDLNHLQFGSLKDKLYYQLLLKRFCTQAAALLSVSEFSKREISTWLGCSEPCACIDVVCNALDESLMSDAASPLDPKWGLTSRKYFISFTNPKPHKNVKVLLEAYTQYRTLAKQRGVEPWPLLLTLEGETRDGIIFAGGVSDEAGRNLLKHAGASVFPSLYEGFGLPPVEAVVAGTAVVVSDIPPHREGLFALEPHEAQWLSPESSNAPAWAEALLKVTLSDGALRPTMASRQKTLDHFSVQRLGENMDRIYRRVLEGI